MAKFAEAIIDFVEPYKQTLSTSVLLNNLLAVVVLRGQTTKKRSVDSG